MISTLCEECRHSIVTRFEDGTMLVRCDYGGGQPLTIHRSVVKCSEFDSRRNTNRYEMEKIAWKIDADKRGGRAGFRIVPPRPSED